jgi:hypothetical protein
MPHTFEVGGMSVRLLAEPDQHRFAKYAPVSRVYTGERRWALLSWSFNAQKSLSGELQPDPKHGA